MTKTRWCACPFNFLYEKLLLPASQSADIILLFIMSSRGSWKGSGDICIPLINSHLNVILLTIFHQTYLCINITIKYTYI